MLPEVSRKRDGLPECGAVVVRQGVSDEHPGAEARRVAEIEVNGPRSVFFCARMCSGGGAPSPRNTFFASWRRAHLPFGTLFLRPGGRPVPSAPLNSPSRPYPAPLNTLAPPPGSTAEPPAPPCPAPLNALVPPRLHRRTPCPSPSRAAEHAGPAPACAAEPPPVPPPSRTGLRRRIRRLAPVPPRLHRRTPCPSPSRAAEHAGPLPVGAPETSPEGPQHAPESPFRGHLSKSRPRSWVFRGIFRTFGCKKCLLQPIT